MKALQFKMWSMTTVAVKQLRKAPEFICISSADLLISATVLDLEHFFTYTEAKQRGVPKVNVEALTLRQQLREFLYDCNEVSPEASDKPRVPAVSNSLYYSLFHLISSFPTL